jgi:hypothetical protein
MADDVSASVITLHQARPKKAKTPRERAKAYRDRKKVAAPVVPVPATSVATVLTPVTPLPPPTVTLRAGEAVAPSRPRVAPILLTMAALALAVVGMTMNGWFAWSLGSSEVAGWLFLAIGVTADLVALVMPSCAAGLWMSHHRATAVAGWTVWLATFIFAVMASIGFASVNIADVTLSRASRVTPAVTVAQTALGDAMAARDRECGGGVGKFCREREAAVVDRRQALDAAMRSVEQIADPQTVAAVHIIAWISRGLLQPTGDDFAMLRLILLALLPQIGGILLMIGRTGAAMSPAALGLSGRPFGASIHPWPSSPAAATTTDATNAG